jgi:hypothetical protein
MDFPIDGVEFQIRIVRDSIRELYHHVFTFGAVVTKLIGISGSLRRGSFNTALLRATAEFVPGGVELAVATIHGIALCTKVTSCKCSLANPVDFTPNATSQIAIKVHVAMQEVSDIYTRAAQPANNLMSMTATNEPALRRGSGLARLHELA